jgi:hypothetical protein
MLLRPVCRSRIVTGASTMRSPQDRAMASVSGSGKSKGKARWKSASARGPKTRNPEVGSVTERPQTIRRIRASHIFPARRSAVL